MNNNPLISVIIPVYNRENLIQSAIKSIVDQTYENLEIIIIDDGSTDCTEEKVKQIKDNRIRYFKNERNMGVSRARNRGIKLSGGEIIALQDSDDQAYPDRLEKQLRLLLSSDIQVGAVYCGMEFYDSKTGKKIGESLRYVDFKENFTQGSYLLTPATNNLIIKKSVFDEVGYFDESMYANVDTELAIRVSKQYKFAFVNECLVKVYRFHDQIMSNAKNQILAKEIIFEKHKDFLSNKILYGICKMIANYYILTNDYSKAKEYILKSFKYKFKIKNLFQYMGLIVSPFSIKYLFNKKYKGQIPISSGLKNKI